MWTVTVRRDLPKEINATIYNICALGRTTLFGWRAWRRRATLHEWRAQRHRAKLPEWKAWKRLFSPNPTADAAPPVWLRAVPWSAGHWRSTTLCHVPLTTLPTTSHSPTHKCETNAGRSCNRDNTRTEYLDRLWVLGIWALWRPYCSRPTGRGWTLPCRQTSCPGTLSLQTIMSRQ